MISRPIILFFSLKSNFDGKIITQRVHHIPVITCDEGIECYSTRNELFYFDDNLHNIALWVLALIRQAIGCSFDIKCGKTCHRWWQLVRDWSLITGRGGGLQHG